MHPILIIKGCILTEPLEHDRTGRTMAVFCDNNFRVVFFIAVAVLIIAAVDKQDAIGVLPDGAGFTQVRQHRLFVLALFDRTRQL